MKPTIISDNVYKLIHPNDPNKNHLYLRGGYQPHQTVQTTKIIIFIFEESTSRTKPCKQQKSSSLSSRRVPAAPNRANNKNHHLYLRGGYQPHQTVQTTKIIIFIFGEGTSRTKPCKQQKSSSLSSGRVPAAPNRANNKNHHLYLRGGYQPHQTVQTTKIIIFIFGEGTSRTKPCKQQKSSSLSSGRLPAAPNRAKQGRGWPGKL